MCEVLNNVVNVISGLDGVLEVRQLSNDDILKIIDMEAQRSKDIVPVFNEGVQECFKRDVCFVIFKNLAMKSFHFCSLTHGNISQCLHFPSSSFRP